ncbi:hypothetical protein DXC97_21640 [Lachnospiraceae bacterium TF09-5]|nr:hypothetical protein DXC97_21640 [Lachnospiraceae bacterium TF09-5]
MNCLYLLLLLCCCGQSGNSGCQNNNCGCGGRHQHGCQNNNSCGCQNNNSFGGQGNSCGCAAPCAESTVRPSCPCADVRPEPIPRPEPRPRTESMPRPYPTFSDGKTCGCEE